MIDLKIPGLRAVREIEREHQLTVLAEVEAHQPPVQCCLLGPAETVRNGTKRVMYRDRPNLGKFVDIHIDRQRFKCKHCGKTLYETIPGVNDKHRMTERLYNHLRTEPDRRTFTAIAAEVGVTEGTVRNVFNAYVGDLLKDYNFETPRVFGIDEKHLLGKYRCVVGNIEEKTLLDTLANRYKNKLGDYLRLMPDKERVEVVCQDMYPAYRDLTAKHFPNAVHVVDKFHVVKKANEAVEKFRRSLKDDIPKGDRVKMKNQRKILLARYSKLKDETREKLDGWLEKYPALGDVYWLKERFYDFYDAKNAAEADARYARWLTLMKPEYEPFFVELLSCMGNWRKHILNYFEHAYTNAYVEGINRALDDIQRAGRGYSFEVMRAKALLAHGHHKRDLPKFVRERFDNKHVSMSPEGWASLPRVNFGVDFESLRRAVCTTNTVARWDGSRYVETVLPSGLSTLKVPELEAA